MIYLDHAATTAVRKEVLEKMLPYFTEIYGNASSQHEAGRQARAAVEEARTLIAKQINADPKEIFFTSGGTESDNWALTGVAMASGKKHIITTNVEHHAILDTLRALETEGFEVTYLKVDEYGLVTPQDVENAIREDTCLISIMMANNEVGTIMPTKEIGEIAKKHGIVFHTDAVQAMGTLDIDVKAMNIDLLSASGHKFYGPKGIGFLYMRRGIKVKKYMQGGAQERNRRAGTENVPAIVGMAEALRLKVLERETENAKTAALRDKLIAELLKIPDSKLNGHPEMRLPNNANVSFAGIEGEALIFSLDMEGICASSGSACMSGSLEPSYVLKAICKSDEFARSSVRFTLGSENTQSDIDLAIKITKEAVDRLRAMSPFYKKKEA